MSPTVPRLKRRAEFLKVARAGRKWAAPGLVLQAWKRPADGDAPRAGFTVSRKVGNAVARNRARRRLKAAAEAVLPELGEPGHDYVLIGRQATLTRAFPALVGDLRRALERVSGAADKSQGRGPGARTRPRRPRKGEAEKA